ncbi:MAG: hypothetical protein AAGI15_08520 [Pseudomonadota bacterium]
MLLYSFELLTVVSAGLLAGALLAEAGVLVPYWRRMPIAEFLRLHHTMASSLFRFYAPLTIAGTMLPIIAGGLSLGQAEPGLLWPLSALCAGGLLLFYLLFFRQANASFATETDLDRGQATLARWAALHAARTLVAVAGFVFAVIAFSGK